VAGVSAGVTLGRGEESLTGEDYEAADEKLDGLWLQESRAHARWWDTFFFTVARLGSTVRLPEVKVVTLSDT
jgi:hypothetical protein